MSKEQSDNDTDSAKEQASESEFKSSGHPEEEHHHTGESGHAHDERLRFWLTNDLLAFPLVLSIPAAMLIHGAGYIDLSGVPEEIRWAWIAFAGIATVWAYGERAAKVWLESKGGGS